MCDCVMLIDDSSIDNFVNQKMIERYEFSSNVIVFNKAVKALKYLQELCETEPVMWDGRLPRVIFLDLNMPVMNGHEFMIEFDKLDARLKSRCKIVVLSSTVNPSEIALAMRSSNVFGYFSKPMMKSNLDKLQQMLKQELALA
jgi:CheY-like chemotaxis protein